ncbi:phage head closure protein [Paracoccus sp. KR1-242]|uniref:phage head closure protein n=1 Tax=Paracoccus sp. KR1-242 TaxID=3410028 RepID=UPI003C11188E
MDVGGFSKFVAFRAPVKGRTPDGQRIIEMQERFSIWAKLVPMRGGEAVMQARLASKSPASVTVPRTRDTELVTSEWEVVVDGRTYQLKEDPRESHNRAFLDMLVEAVS